MVTGDKQPVLMEIGFGSSSNIFVWAEGSTLLLSRAPRMATATLPSRLTSIGVDRWSYHLPESAEFVTHEKSRVASSPSPNRGGDHCTCVGIHSRRVEPASPIELTTSRTVLCELTRDFHPVLSPSFVVAEDSRSGEGFQICLDLQLASSSTAPRSYGPHIY